MKPQMTQISLMKRQRLPMFLSAAICVICD